MKIRHIVLAVSACVLSPLLFGASPESVFSDKNVIQPAYAETSCAEGLFGDLDGNGVCCVEGDDRCCYVPPRKGECYCVSRLDRCDRY